MFHGIRFSRNPVWLECGPRSLILLISLDWFPPFKSRDYTVDVLTVKNRNGNNAKYIIGYIDFTLGTRDTTNDREDTNTPT